MRILVTGATGYVGGQLVPRLLAAGHRVRVLARDPARLAGRSWADAVEAMRGDVLDPESLPAALAGLVRAGPLPHGAAPRHDLPALGETRIQPIAIDDVIEYLARALDVPASAGRIVEIGGADVITYRDMILGYARARGLRRHLISVPVLTPRLSSYWVHAVTPIPTRIARPLIEGLGTEVVARGDLARQLFPEVRPLPYAEALRAALANLDRGQLESTWSDALASSAGDVPPVLLATQEGMILERRQLQVRAPAAAVFHSFTGLGGRRGWLYGTWLWWLRGLVDRAVGGVGLRRGRRDPDALRPGDALDFWRVEEVRPDALLRLRAEMRVPGRAWLEFRVTPAGHDHATLVQTAYFAPRGLAGHAYWYVLYPLHAVIFSKLASRVAERARRIASGAER